MDDAPVKKLDLDIAGVGMIIYSPPAVSHIEEGSDYLSSDFTTAQQVQRHLQKGDITTFGTGSPGTYRIEFYTGYPDKNLIDQSDYKLRLAIRAAVDLIVIRDLCDLIDWEPKFDSKQSLELESGFYHLTLISNRPASGLIGDRQLIQIYFSRLARMPALTTQGIPMLYG